MIFVCLRVPSCLLYPPQPHSEVPQNDEDWPSLDSILEFQNRVRQRVRNLYDDLESGKIELTRKIGRVLFMVLEHEGFHAEVCT